jgi:hypothetical protein
MAANKSKQKSFSTMEKDIREAQKDGQWIPKDDSEQD